MGIVSLRHLWVTGTPARTHMHLAEMQEGRAVLVSVHRNLRGPYTGVDTVLEYVLPVAWERWPELVERHRFTLLHALPELARFIGPPPTTIANSSPYEQQTRFFHAGMVRAVSNGIVSFLLGFGDALRAAGESRVTFAFTDVEEAESTTAELLAQLVRRAQPEWVRVVLVSEGPELADELAGAVQAHAWHIEAGGPGATSTLDDRKPAALVKAYVHADGTSKDYRLEAAYQAADARWVRSLHDERADQLEALGWSPVGAICYHRERGSRPSEAGRRALCAALTRCVQTGFSAAIVDIGRRGRAVSDPEAHSKDYCDFTMQMVYALVDLGHPAEALGLCMELRLRYTDPEIHILTSYTIAMLHTRFFVPRDHDSAVAWQNNAISLARLLPDQDKRRLQIGFQDNALALIEMHRGNLHHALRLVEAGIDRLDREVPPDQWVMHRTQLLHNRARLLTALGRHDEARDGYAMLIERDPYYTEYLTDRARIARRSGDLGAALQDYDRAIELAPPFPELYYNRGTARQQVGDEAGALEDFTYALELEPSDEDSRTALVEMLIARQNYAEAETHVSAGLESSPRDPQLLCALGTIVLHQGDASRARPLFDEALAVDAAYPAALVNRAVAAFELGDLNQAVRDLTCALELTGDDPDILLNRGQAHAATGAFADARRDFELALTLAGADTGALHHHLGTIYLRGNRWAEARRELQRAADIDPDNPEIRAALRRCTQRLAGMELT